MEEIVIRLLRDDDIQQVNALYQKAYQIKRSDDKFKWEFQRGPAGPAIYAVAVDPKTNRVVGTLCAIPLYVTNVPGDRILTAKAEDALFDPDYRGRNIFEKVYALLFDECRKAGIVAIWGFTYAIKPFRKLGFDIPFRCDFGLIAFNSAGAYKYLNGLKGNRSLIERMKIAGLVLASRLKYIFQFGSTEVEGQRISKDVQVSLENLTPSLPDVFFLLHDSKFLGWRLRENPYPNTHLYYSLINDAGKQTASVICSQSGDVAYIMHLFFDRELAEEMKEHFLAAVIRDLSRKTSILRFWGFTHNDAGRQDVNLLKRSGFIFTNQGISFVWKKLDETSSLNVNNFALSRMASQGT